MTPERLTDLRHMVYDWTLDGGRLRNALDLALDEVERLESLFQRTHGVHHGWVAECERLRAENDRERDNAKAAFQRQRETASIYAELRELSKRYRAERDAALARVKGLASTMNECRDCREVVRLFEVAK